MESSKIQEIITETLKQYGFNKEPEFRSKSWLYWVLIFGWWQLDKLKKDLAESEVEVLKLMKEFRELESGEGIKISRTKITGTITIMDAEVIESMASGLDGLYRRKFGGMLSIGEVFGQSFKEFYYKDTPLPLDNLDAGFVNKRLFFLEEIVLPEFGLQNRKNQNIGIFADGLLDYLKDEGIFKGQGKGVAKEFACIYDIFTKIGFPMAVDEYEPNTNTTKYRCVAAAIRAARKMDER